MSASTDTPETPVPALSAGTGEVALLPGRWKGPILFAIFTVVIGLLVVLAPHDGDAGFRLATDTDFFQLSTLTLPSTATTWMLVALMALATAAAAALAFQGRRTPLWLIAPFAVCGILGFLTWAVAGQETSLTELLAGSIALAVPLVFGALGGVLGERAGVVNIAIEGQLLLGAFAAAMFGTIGNSPWVGLLAAMLAGALVALVLGFFAITYFVDQVIVGVVLNVLVVGITSFLFSQLMADNPASLNAPTPFSRWPIPVLGDIPVLGPVLFRQTPLVYLMYVAVVVVSWALYRTRWGLRVRAVGEHPKAADTVGIKVNRTRYRTLLIAGLIAGAGGATFTLISANAFDREMTGGAGYIALAAVIFGRWDPVRATLAALLFGFASNVEGALSAIGAPVPSQFMLMLPYVVTIIAVAGLVGTSRAPAADGIPYRKA